ncbi:MAG TPA: cadherin domain-containing protein, partial [Lacipirellula sp.]
MIDTAFAANFIFQIWSGSTWVPADNYYDISSTGGFGSFKSFGAGFWTVNDAGVATPLDDDSNANAVDENASAGTAVGITAQASDADLINNTVNYSLSDSAGGRFTIDPATGVVATGATNIDRETDGASLNITVLASSSDGSTASETFAIAIGDVDESDVSTPADINGAANSVVENAGVGAQVGITASASDVDATNNVVTYSLLDETGAAADAGGLFQIDASTGVVTVALANLDYESAVSHQINVRATSADGSTNQWPMLISIVDVNEFNVTTPVDATGAANTVAENVVAGATVGITASAIDADGSSNAVAYSLVNNAGGLFDIDVSTGAITVAGVLDYETATTHTVRVRATSQDGSQREADFTIDIADFDEFDVTAPVDVDGTDNEIAESAAVGATVGIIASASDDDATTSGVVYSLVDDAGGLFSIDASTGAVTVAASLDYETATSHVVRVRATSDDGSQSETDFTIDILPVNDISPAITSGNSFSLAENTTAVGNVTAIDADAPGDTLAYSLSGADAAHFSIDASGAITFNAAPDFENPLDADGNNLYELTVTVDDQAGGTPAVQAITVTLTAVNDNDPVITSGNAFSIDEEGTAVTTVTATDADLPGDTLAYAISGGADQGLFSIDSATGALSFAAAPNFENPADQGADNVYEVEVSVSDQAGGVVATQLITVTVQDISEEMELGEGTAPIPENARLVRDGDYVQLVDEQGNVVPGSRHLFANVTSIVINGTDNVDDTFVVDFSGGNPVAPGGLTFNGGVGGHDTIVIEADGFYYNKIAWNYTNASDGSIELDNTDASLDATINYTGLEPVLVNVGTVEDAEFNLPTGSDAVLEDAGGGNLQLRSPSGDFETTVFPAPADSLTINGDASLAITTAVTASTEIALNVTDLTLNADLTAPSLVGTATTVTVDDVPAVDPAQIQDAIDVAAAGAVVSV